MPDTAAPKHPIWTTPLRDLARGRVTGRLDWRARLAVSGLPPAVQALIVTVVRRTRLWRLEKAAVADELIAHFADAAEAGVTAEAMVADFGNAGVAAKLIRRAKRRNRPLAWHVWVFAIRGVLVLAVLYGCLLAWFLTRRPTVSVDYLAKLNAPESAVPEADRAWPLYRRAMLALDVVETRRGKTLEQAVEGIALSEDRAHVSPPDLNPVDPAWPAMTAWLDAHAGGLRLLREAAAKPSLGFIYGPNASARDPELGWAGGHLPIVNLPADALTGLLIPVLNPAREMGTILLADTRYAFEQGDADRVAADLDALLDLAHQQQGPFLVNHLVAMAIDDRTFEEIERLLSARPYFLTDAQLVALAHCVAAVGGDAPASLIDTTTERMNFYDLLQRIYSDDGRGSGTLTKDGSKFLQSLDTSFSNGPSRDMPAGVSIISARIGMNALISSRRTVREEFDRLMDLQEAVLARPLRESSGPETPAEQLRRRREEVLTSPWLSARYLPVAAMTPSFIWAAWSAERVIGRRDGVTTGLALELYRRQHGTYPATLDALVPAFMPKVPLDRIDGRPIRYRVIDGRPVVYSVGVDRDDDGGRVPVDKGGRPVVWMAAQWPETATGDETPADVDGDWVLFDGRKPLSTAARPTTTPMDRR